MNDYDFAVIQVPRSTDRVPCVEVRRRCDGCVGFGYVPYDDVTIGDCHECGGSGYSIVYREEADAA